MEPKGKPVSRILPAAILLLLVAPSTLWGSDDSYRSGRMLLREGRTEDSIRAFERALTENPDHLEALFHLARIHSRQVSSYGKAEAELLRIPGIAMKVGGTIRDEVIFRAGLQLGKLYIKSGQYGKAIHVLEGTIASPPPGISLDDAYNSLGLAYYYERLYDKASLMLKCALKANPDNMKAKFNLRTFQARLVHFQVGDIYSRIGDPESSIEVLSRSIEIDPRFVEARMMLGMELIKVGRNEEALKEFSRAERFSRKFKKVHEIWYGQGLALAALGRRTEAVERFRMAAGRSLRFSGPHNELGKIYLEQGDFAEALQSFAIAIQIEPRGEYLQNLQATIRKLR